MSDLGAAYSLAAKVLDRDLEGWWSSPMWAACSVAVKLPDLDPQGRWFDPRVASIRSAQLLGP